MSPEEKAMTEGYRMEDGDYLPSVRCE